MNRSDTEKTVCGVPGRLTHATTKPGQKPGLWFMQRWISASRPIQGYGPGAVIRAEIRFDDELGNGHNSFAVTADIYRMVKYAKGARKEEIAGGCCHEEIAAAFPEPLYHDNKPGETYKFGPKYTFGGYGERWHEGPFDSEQEALDFLYALNHCDPQFVRVATLFGEGKARELDTARRCAVWPEATDEELSADKATLTAALLARRPALVAAFRADIEAAGFDWEPSEQVAA